MTDQKSDQLTWVRVRTTTRTPWVIIMFLLGTTDVLINWVNFADLSSPELQYGLVIGPPTYTTWVILLAFTIAGSVLFIPETINTFSVFFRNGDIMIPLCIELLITLPLEHLPLAAVNFFISSCRRRYNSPIQTACGSIRIMYVFARLVWHAHMEGKLLKKDDKRKVKKALFMLCCVVYSCAMSFPVMNWRNEPSKLLKDEYLQNVSVYLFEASLIEKNGYKVQNEDSLLGSENKRVSNPLLVKTILNIVRDQNDTSYYATYRCDKNITASPRECRGKAGLRFRFVYTPNQAGPYGGILYNFATVIKIADGNINTGLHQVDRDLQDGWRLFYFSTVPKDSLDSKSSLSLHSPWYGTCDSPRLWYDPFLNVLD